MSWNITFFFTSILLGLGLAVDGFLISLSNGLNYVKTKRSRIIFSGLVFALFQFSAVILGWLCVAEISKKIPLLENIISYIAFTILIIIGLKMIVEWAKKRRKTTKANSTMQNSCEITEETLKDSTMQNDGLKNSHKQKNFQNKESKKNFKVQSEKDNFTNNYEKKLPKGWFLTIIVQGFITSVDALSVGFVLSKNSFLHSLTCGAIISLITFLTYIIGFNIGKKFGVKLSKWAELVGGIVFILIAVETLINSIIN